MHAPVIGREHQPLVAAHRSVFQIAAGIAGGVLPHFGVELAGAGECVEDMRMVGADRGECTPPDIDLGRARLRVIVDLRGILQTLKRHAITPAAR